MLLGSAHVLCFFAYKKNTITLLYKKGRARLAQVSFMEKNALDL